MVRGWGPVVRGGSYRGPRPREGVGGSIIRFIPMPHAARFTVSLHSSRGSLAPRALSARLRAATHEQRKRADSIATASGTGPIRGRIAPPNPPPLPRLDPRGGGRGRGGLRANLEKKMIQTDSRHQGWPCASKAYCASFLRAWRSIRSSSCLLHPHS